MVTRGHRMVFTVPGVPQPKGSTRSFVSTDAGGGLSTVTISANAKNKAWQQNVGLTALAAGARLRPMTHGPVFIWIAFYFQNPKRAAAPHVVKPDLDKLTRSVLDALTGVCYKDDAQVNFLEVTKGYTEGQPHADITVET